jgi:hypothetical protein
VLLATDLHPCLPQHPETPVSLSQRWAVPLALSVMTVTTVRVSYRTCSQRKEKVCLWLVIRAVLYGTALIMTPLCSPDVLFARSGSLCSLSLHPLGSFLSNKYF